MSPFDGFRRIETEVFVIAPPNELDALGQTIDHLNRNSDARQTEQIADFGQPYRTEEVLYLFGPRNVVTHFERLHGRYRSQDQGIALQEQVPFLGNPVPRRAGLYVGQQVRFDVPDKPFKKRLGVVGYDLSHPPKPVIPNSHFRPKALAMGCTSMR